MNLRVGYGMRILPIAFVAAFAAATPALAQENYEIQVYPSKTADPKTTLFELHSNWTGSGSLRVPGGLLGTNHALHETIEITHGFSDIFELGVYLFTAQPTSGGLQYVGAHIRPRIRAPESWKLPVGLSLSTEFGPTDGKFDENTFGIELRPIVDQEIGNFYWAFNPNLEWALEGADAGRGIHGMTFNPNLKLSWKLHEKYAAGVEYYGTTGSLTRLAPFAEQQHILYPTVDFFLAPEWELNVGYGVNIAGHGDQNILKVIVGRRFGF
jgi:hypothetical protein